MAHHDSAVTGAPVASRDPRTPDTSDLRSSVTISRQHLEDARQRQVLARLDSGPTKTLMFGDRVTHDVQPGAHVLKMNNTLFWKTLRFTIEPGEQLEFVVVNRASRFTFGFLAGLGLAPLYMTIEKRSIV
ncbi:MAG: hypothetical protein ABI634_01095 [Acidobacteriota bacterium]